VPCLIWTSSSARSAASGSKTTPAAPGEAKW
jgi:hypothetical protein